MPHTKAILQALFVTFIWSLSWVFIKVGLDDIPALIFAGLRYSLAALSLLIFAAYRSDIGAEVRGLSKKDWAWLSVLGLIFYSVTQGTQFLALNYLPAVTLSLMLNFSAIIVAVMGAFMLKERPNWQQWLGIGIFIVGALVYFGPVAIPQEQMIGLFIGFLSVVATSTSSILGRYVNRDQRLSPLTVTVISMSIGSVILLLAGIATEGIPNLSIQSWGIIVWLAIVHTAFAFTLWNNTLRTLSAIESNIINNTMLVQIAILAWLFLGEILTPLAIFGLVLVVIGTLIVQLAAHQGKKTE